VAEERPASTLEFLSGGGELGALMRAFDWEKTSLGPPAQWPQNLRIAIRIMLASRQPIWVGWGRELIYFYNDAYKSIIGGKHPWALGKPTRQVWSEIWDDIGPLLRTATEERQGTYVESQLLIMQRSGYPEETYYTFSYSPIPNDDGSVGGIICANTDDTQRVIGERRLALLRDLGAVTAGARTLDDAYVLAASAIASDARDIPFAILYMADPDGQTFRRVALSGIEADHPAAQETIAAGDWSLWPLGEVALTRELKLVPTGARALPSASWPQSAAQTAVLPLTSSGDSGRGGVLVCGLNPFRPFDDEYKSFLGLLGAQIAAVIANVQAYDNERRRAEALSEIDRAKTLFFSNVSHEFRTPLTLMLGPIEDLLNDETASLPTPHRDRLDTAHRNSLRLLKLVNSLLDFSRIEAGRMGASFEPTDLAKLTAELASNFVSAMEKARLELKIDCLALPQPVYIDRDAWEKIVLNLLSNAFKFTFDGEIAVSVGVSEDGRAAELVVRDTGVGIPGHELPRLFERFHRVEGQKSRSFEGSGIGLALVQELVKLHGGTIRVESVPDKGSTFVVSIPFGTAHLAPERIGAAPSQTSTFLRADAYIEEALRWLPETGEGDFASHAGERAADAAHILVVDDNADMRDYVCRLLVTRWHVETATNGREALAVIREQKPSLVLTDVMMPVMDGYEFLRELRGDPELRALPVILLSARAGEEARVEGLDSGADDYLTKPFSARELVARVNTNLELARMRQDVMRELRESEARFRNMADNAPVMMWVTDARNAITYLNRGWCEFVGQTLEEVLGDGAWNALHPDDRDAASRAVSQANADKRPFRLECRIKRADGVYRWALGAASPRFADDGEFLGYIGSIIDITDRKDAEEILQESNVVLERRVNAALAQQAEAEAQLRQAQKMEAVGKLTGGVAHDFNNVLQVISGNLQLLARDVAGNDRAEQRLKTAMTATSRGSKLASQLLAFGRRTALAPKVVNLGRFIRGIDDMIRRAIGEGVEVETIVAGGLWNSFVDIAQIENAILNLAINARDAMEGHGRLTIEAGNAYLDDGYAERHAEVAPGQYVMVAVTDTGCGIPAHLIEQVFEPFFTTKPEGQGTGLGLSMVYGFVKQSGGHVKIYSEPGSGTTVRMYLPRARAAEEPEAKPDLTAVSGGAETVLVAEDDENVRGTVVDMLTDLGYRVLAAQDARSALAIIESGAAIDLLFTDVVMPGTMRSPELARRAREIIPDIAVVFTSGYTENSIVHGGRLDEGVDLLSKPYSREALARKLGHALRGKRQREKAREGTKSATPGPGRDMLVRSWRIILAEDDALIRLSTVDMLESLGHSVLEASDAREVLTLLESEEADILVTDVNLPGMSGIDLAAEAVRRKPDLRVVFATGYDIGLTSMTDEVRARSAALQKPYSEQDLAAALKSVIEKQA
jgi:PAS domain S-box-containing protein